MHDIDQVVLEDSPRAPDYEDEEYLVFSGELDGEDETVLEDEGETGFDEEESSEGDELELAAQFLEVTSEPELEQFIGDLVSSASGALSNFARTREGRQIGGILKHAAGRVLPVLSRAAGRAAGGAVARATGGPEGRYQRTGEQIGGSLGALAKRAFGLELEGISPEDQELEVARSFVRFATDAVRDSLRRLGTGTAPQITRQAIVTAGRRWAPGLVTERMLDAAPLPRWSAAPANRIPSRAASASQTGSGAQASPARPCPSCGTTPLAASGGRWERRGNAIVLFTR